MAKQHSSLIIPFLGKLSKNNNKPWFDAHRDDYVLAKGEMVEMVQKLIVAIAQFDPAYGQLEAKSCLFRINRDVRFSKDKAPYKRNFAAFIQAEGKKSPLAGYYLHIEPGASMIGGGLWMPVPERLQQVRQEIDYQLDEFRKILSAAAFRKQFGGLYRDNDIALSRVPRGYPQDHPAGDLLRLKSFFAMRSLSDDEVNSAELHKHCAAACRTAKPLVDFLNRAMD